MPQLRPGSRDSGPAAMPVLPTNNSGNVGGKKGDVGGKKHERGADEEKVRGAE